MTCNLRTVNGPTLSFTVCTDRTDRQTVTPYTQDENIISPLNEIQFTDRQQSDQHDYSLSERTVRNVALTDCSNASILEKPLIEGRIICF